MTVGAEELVALIASDFYDTGLDLSSRRTSLDRAVWDAMPEVEAAQQVRAVGAPDDAVRMFLTLIAAMDRSRDATSLWRAGVVLFGSEPEVFDANRAADLPFSRLKHLLVNSGVSQRHEPDARAWHRIAESLATDDGSPVQKVIRRGVGDADELLKDVKTEDHAGPRFPMLRGPKIGPMWVRMLTEPGGATITRIDTIPVAVDVHVRRISEYLGIVTTQGLALRIAKPKIQSAWQKAVAASADLFGPSRIAGTCAALDPALWSFGKYGCRHCETVGERVPIGRACAHCRLRSTAVWAGRPDGGVGSSRLPKRILRRVRMSRYDSFWRTVVARPEFRSAVEAAVNALEGRISVSGLTACGSRTSKSTQWRGTVYVRHPKSVRAGMSHAKSLGNMAIESGLLATWPGTEFCFTIDKTGEWLTVRTVKP